MKKLLIYFLTILIFSCQKAEDTNSPKTTNYNIEANKLIRDIINQENWKSTCLLEISRKSVLQTTQENQPFHAGILKKNVMQSLRINSEKKLDSLEKLSEGFILDQRILKQKKIKLVSSENFKFVMHDTLTCPKGIMIINKPIFSNDFETAVISKYLAFSSIMMIETYKSINGKWIKGNSR